MATFKVNDRRIRRNLMKAKKYFTKKNRFPTEVYNEFKRVTPKQSGNAKRKTKLTRKGRGYQIKGDYPYSGVIDRGEYPNPPKFGTGKTSGGYSKKNLRLAKPFKGLIDPSIAFARKITKRFLRRLR